MTICGLSRATKKDIEAAYNALKYAPKFRLHTFLATSDIHLEYKLKITRQECIRKSVDAILYAKEVGFEDIEFSAEDAGRSDPDFMAEVFREVINAGASTINVPDTVGFTTPGEYGGLIKYLIAQTENSDKAVWSTHCHNDLGLAVANSLEGIKHGARQCEVTINGIGERAGNTSLEEIVMTLQTRPGIYPCYTDIISNQIMRSSKMVSGYTGMLVQPNKAIVGANAFAHEAGIHQDGVLKHAATYEIMRPESVGVVSNLVLGKHSGKHAFKARLDTLGYAEVTSNAELVSDLFHRFKVLADQKKTINDADLDALVADEVSKPEEIWKLESCHVFTGTAARATATIALIDSDGNRFQDAALGQGPVEAIYKAIGRITGLQLALTDLQIKSVSEGQDALGVVSVRIKDISQGSAISNEEFGGHSTDIDTMKASGEAFVHAINKLLASQSQKQSEKVERPGKHFLTPGSQQQTSSLTAP